MFEYNQATVLFFTSNRHFKMCCVEVFVSYIHLEEKLELIFDDSIIIFYYKT